MRPDVRVIQDQQSETTPVEVHGYEAEQLLRKYAPNQKFTTHQEPIAQTVSNDLTFEEMVALEEEKLRKLKEQQTQRENAPQPITFNGQNGYESEIRYKSDDSGFGFQITVSTDMRLPNY